MQQDNAVWFEGLENCVSDYLIQKRQFRSNPKLKPLSGDAGFRRYFRVAATPPVIAVYSPPHTENNGLFCQIADYFRSAGLYTPTILYRDLQRGYLLLEDLGDNLLLDALQASSASGLYQKAFQVLLTLQKLNPDPTVFPPYSRALLDAETSLFSEWYLGRLLNLPLGDRVLELISDLTTLLSSRALAQKPVIVHRDFHSRNLMLQTGKPLAVIDFQDAVIGPLTYDLVSLLKDCYVRWDQTFVEDCALSYLSAYRDLDTSIHFSEEEFLKDFHLMGLQRHLKVLGIFARLSLRDSKHGYLADLPRVMAYVLETCAMYPELTEFHEFLREQVVPKALKAGFMGHVEP